METVKAFNLKRNYLNCVTLLTAVLVILLAAASPARDVTFIHISDQHYNIDEKAPEAEQKKLTKAEKVLPATIEAMNELPGTAYPDAIGGSVDKPRGVVMTGDLVNDGTAAEMERWVGQWGLTGEEGLINYPVYEGTGNHDGSGPVRQVIIERNQSRPGVVNTSESAFHYSWDWDDVHFVQLNEYTGPEDDQRYSGNVPYGRKRQSYGNLAGKSLQFLRRDLASQVGDSKRPVILMQHYGFGSFPLHPWGNDAAWWTEEHAMRLWEAIEGYNVISILSGHDGSEAVIDWNGIPNRHMDDSVRFGVYRIDDEKVTVAVRNSKAHSWERTYQQPTLVDASLPPSLIAGPYLVYEGEPGTMTVLWRTSEDADCTLRWGEDRFTYEDGKVKAEPFDDELNLYKHTITDLKPNACIKFALQIDEKYAPGMFYSAPAGADKVKFLIAGEQKERENRRELYETIYQEIYEDAAYHSVMLMPGELVADTAGISSWDDEFFSRKKADSHMRWIQSRMPVVVPHDGSEAREKLFAVEGAESGWYRLNYGPVTFVVLNAEEDLGIGSRQNKWLQSTLEEDKNEWRVVMCNVPGDRPKAATFKKNLAAVTDAWDIDLCVVGNAEYDVSKRNSTTWIAPGSHSIAVTIEGGKLVCEMFEFDGDEVGTTILGRGRDASCPAPPAQTPACGTTAT